MKRVLKDGGKLFIGEGYILQPLRMLMNFLFRFSDSGDFHSYGKHELIRMLKANGFQVAEAKRTSKHTMLYIAIA